MSNVTRFESEGQRRLRDISESENVEFGTDAPYHLGKVGFSLVGFASLPVVVFVGHCPSVEAFVPVARQHMLRACKAAGLDTSALTLKPMVGAWRKQKFVDENKSSKSFGKNKIASRLIVSLEITRPEEVAAYRAALPKVYL